MRRVFPIILGTTLTAIMGVALISPALPVVQDHFSLSDFQVGFLITIYTLPAILLAPLMGWLSDYLNRRIILLPSLLLFGFTGGAISLVSSYSLILILRFLQGVGGTSLVLLSRTLIGDHYEYDRRGTIMGINDAVLSIGAALFPLVGGLLAEQAWYWPFWVFGLAIPLGIAAYLTLDPVQNQSETVQSSYLEDLFSALIRRRGALLLGGTLLVFFLLFGTVHTASPLLLSRTFNLSSGTIGFMISTMAISAALVSFLNGYLTQFIRPGKLIYFGLGGYGGGLIVMGLTDSPLTYTLGLCLLGCGHGLSNPSLNTELVSLVPARLRGGVMSSRTIMARAGQTTGPFLASLLGGMLGYSQLLVAGGVLCLVLIAGVQLTARI